MFGIDFKEILFRIPAVLLAVAVHESAHGFVAYRLGDPTAKSEGRLTLNPLAHFDLFGVLCMILFGFGWARPVPINPLFFKKPKYGISLVGLAGPLSNFLMAILFSLLYGLGFRVGYFYTDSMLAGFLATFLSVAISLNVGLGIFNLLPIPPLDGSKILAAVLPPKALGSLFMLEKYTIPILMVLLFTNILEIPLNFFGNIVIDGLEVLISWVAGVM